MYLVAPTGTWRKGEVPAILETRKMKVIRYMWMTKTFARDYAYAREKGKPEGEAWRFAMNRGRWYTAYPTPIPMEATVIASLMEEDGKE